MFLKIARARSAEQSGIRIDTKGAIRTFVRNLHAVRSNLVSVYVQHRKDVQYETDQGRQGQGDLR